MQPGMLILGWNVTRGFDPSYWVRGDASPAGHSDDDVVTVSAKSIAAHTAIVAQSGSGKSFLLGRLLEEILLRTKARCLVLDPNGDFLRCHDVVRIEENQRRPCMWTRPTYHANVGLGFLTHEFRRDEFAVPWSKIPKVVRTSVSRADSTSKNTVRLVLPWTSLSSELLSADVEPILRGEVSHCHEFVRAVSRFREVDDLLSEAELLLAKFGGAQEMGFTTSGRELWSREFQLDRLVEKRVAENKQIQDLANDKQLMARLTALTEEADFDESAALKVVKSFRNEPLREYLSDPLLSKSTRYVISDVVELLTPELSANLERLQHAERDVVYGGLDVALKVAAYIGNTAARFYFGKARLFEGADIFDTSSERDGSLPDERDLEIVALSSIPSTDVKRLVVSSLLDTELERARASWEQVVLGGQRDKRVPTFIVVDEAHNFMSTNAERNPAESALLEQFRTVAAEGRKYGLFLLIVSQRPDKLDSRIVSECENKIVMKMGSRAVLDVTTRMLGLDDLPNKVRERCLEFPQGRALLAGAWTEHPTEFFTAARRTEEGGRNLDKEHWAAPRAGVQNELERQHILNSSLRDSDLGRDPAVKILIDNLQLETISDLTSKKGSELLAVSGFGKNSLKKLKTKLKSLDLKLQDG